jgi:two-component system sensor histidine kinase CreC
LSLARIEARGAEAFEPVELALVAQKARATLGDAAQRVELSFEGDTQVRGDPMWLARAVSNLVDNAITHASDDSPVRLKLSRRASEVELTIGNAGEIPPYLRERLFRRFVTSRGDKGGSGLGLAIVRAVAEAHGGRVELVNAGPPQVCFRLSLPAA